MHVFPRSIRRVFVSKKHEDTRARDCLLALTQYLRSRDIEYILEPCDPDLPQYSNYCAPGNQNEVDLIVCLGGDGTVLRTVDAFGLQETRDQRSSIPPVLAFAVGSLGFLTPHAFADFQTTFERLLKKDVMTPVTYRSRLRCEVLDHQRKSLGVKRVLNECLVARGCRTSFHKLDVLVDGQYVAQFQADGLILATPSGSSAYSLSAGGSLVAPNVKAMLLTPIAPHSLSTRPLILPADSSVEVQVPKQTRRLPVASFDGGSDMELQPGSSVIINTSSISVPFINNSFNQTPPLSDWFLSLRSKLHWAQELRP